MCNPSEVVGPCYNIACRHHIAFDINNGKGYQKWDFISTDRSESFKNCMCLIKDGERLGLDEIAEMFGVAHQSIAAVERIALDQLRRAIMKEGN